ncbi:uncharacterized protein A4U43_C04F25410, partial [Asparagus officinalis]
PTVLMYTYLYNFAKDLEDLGARLFLAWAGWFCSCEDEKSLDQFTRVAGELFGMLITVLLFQEAIKGLVSEFNVPKGEDLSLMGGFRGFIADYGVPLMVVAWTAISYATPNNVPSGVPRRLFSPLPWDSKSVHHWAVAKARASKPLFS